MPGSASAMKKLLPVIAGILTAAVVVGGIVGVARRSAEGQQADATVPGSRIRWVNVSIDAPPEGSPVRVSTGIPITGTPNPSFSHRYTVSLSIDPETLAPGSGLAWLETVIDAETGEVLKDTLSAQYPEARAILASVALETDLPKVWPFVDGPVPAARRNLLGLSVPQPSTESGLLLSWSIGLCASAEPCNYAIILYGSSFLAMDVSTGAVAPHSKIAPEHASAFARVVAAVTVVPEPSIADPTPHGLRTMIKFMSSSTSPTPTSTEKSAWGT